jgi:hypothetical protein
VSEATYKKITLTGEDYVLKFDFNAISELEQHYQKGIHAIVSEETIGFNTVRNIFWAGMLWKNPNLKPYHVGRMLEQDLEENNSFDFEELMQTAIESLYNSKAFKLLSNNKKSDKNGKN